MVPLHWNHLDSGVLGNGTRQSAKTKSRVDGESGGDLDRESGVDVESGVDLESGVDRRCSGPQIRMTAVGEHAGMIDSVGDAASTRPYDLVVWSAPGDVDAERAAEVVGGWLAVGGDPAGSPFERTTDMGWFYRELREDLPNIDATSDAVPRVTKVPIWASGSDEAPARVVAIRLDRGNSLAARAELELVYSLATKYDLVVFGPAQGIVGAGRNVVHRPLERMAAYASATFWPRGAIQATTAGGAGAVIAVIAWFVGIPILSGIAIIVGAFLFLMSVLTFVVEGRKRLRVGSRPPTG
jgi:hypothetical protein